MVDLDEYKLIVADLEGNVHYVRKAENVIVTAGCKSSNIWFWYEKFGHLNSHDLNEITKNKLNIKINPQHLVKLLNLPDEKYTIKPFGRRERSS